MELFPAFSCTPRCHASRIRRSTQHNARGHQQSLLLYKRHPTPKEKLGSTGRREVRSPPLPASPLNSGQSASMMRMVPQMERSFHRYRIVRKSVWVAEGSKVKPFPFSEVLLQRPDARDDDYARFFQESGNTGRQLNQRYASCGIIPGFGHACSPP